MKRRQVVVGLILAFFFALSIVMVFTEPAPAAEPQAKVYKWRLADHWVRGTAAFKKLGYVCDLIKEASGGRLDIQHFGAGEIVASSEELWDATSNGQVEMACSLGGYHMNIDPTLAFDSMIPFAYKSPYEMNALMFDWGVAELLVKNHAKYNVYPIFTPAIYGNPWTPMTNFPIRKVSDMKGKKVRAFGLTAEILKEAGAAVVFLPLDEVYVALERKIIDGVFNGPLAFACQHGFQEVTKYTFRPGVYGGNGATIYVNLDKWNSLPNDLKAIVKTAWGGYYSLNNPGQPQFKEKSWGGSGYDYLEESAVFKMIQEKYKYTVTDFPDEERAKVFPYILKVFDKYSKKSADFGAVAGRYRDFWKNMGYVQ